VTFASPVGGEIGWPPRSNPYYEKSAEAGDLVSKGFISDPLLRNALDNTKQLKAVDLAEYDAVHVAGGRCATFDLTPNEDVARVLKHFWSSRQACRRDLARRHRACQRRSSNPWPKRHGVFAGRPPRTEESVRPRIRDFRIARRTDSGFHVGDRGSRDWSLRS
jgi:hypothetical protein